MIEEKQTPTADVRKIKVELDADAVDALNEIRKEIKGEGISGVTYSDVIRFLLVKAGVREGRM